MSVLRKNKGKVFVGLSGGVDSAVSAALLQKQGYDVTGVFIRITVPGYPCTAGADRLEAMRVAAHLRIPFFELDLSKEYARDVFQASIRGFGAGETPNPDALCNRQIKFGAFYRFAKANGADFIATGHYAKLTATEPLKASVRLGLAARSARAGEVRLLVGADSEKDQSYFLWAVPQEVLAQTIFPVGGMHKVQVRALAKKFKLPNAGRKDSQGLCFLGPISIDEMLKQELRPEPGDVLSEDGEIIGHHEGAELYTLGQRHGFETSARGADSSPLYVIAKNIAANTITVSPNKYPRNAAKTKIILRDENWIGQKVEGKVQARFRYRQKLIPATISFSNGRAEVELQEPHYVPVGQSLVLYVGEQASLPEGRCLGGGSVDKSVLA